MVKTEIEGVVIIEGHVQGLSNARSLGEMGIPVYIVDTHDAIARYSRYCVKYYCCPEFNSAQFTEFLIHLAQQDGLQNWLLLPSNDHAVYRMALDYQLLKPYYRMVISELDVINRIYDKSELLKLASGLGLPIPKTQYFYHASEPIDPHLTFPLLTKGRHGLSFYKSIGKKALISHNSTQLYHQLGLIERKYSIAQTFTQEVIPCNGKNKTISFAAFCERGHILTYWMGEKVREHPLQFGTATYARSVHVETCLHQATTLLSALNYTGVCEVEFLQDPRSNAYLLIEINPRTWLWVGLARACGVDFARIVYDYAHGNHIDYPKKYTLGMGWINPLTDTFYSFLALLKLQLNFRDYWNSLAQKKVNALYLKGDYQPFWAYLKKMFSFIKYR